MNRFAMLIFLSSFWIFSSQDESVVLVVKDVRAQLCSIEDSRNERVLIKFESDLDKFVEITTHITKLWFRCSSIWYNLNPEPKYVRICIDTIHELSLQSDRELLLQTVIEEPRKCLFIYRFYNNRYIAETCLRVFRNMSIVAEALSIQNDTGLLYVNTMKLASRLRNMAEQKLSDWTIAGLCLILTPVEVIRNHIETVILILANMMAFTDGDIYFRSTFYEAYQNVETAIQGIDGGVTVVSANLAVVAWYPFQSDFNGIAWYGNTSSSEVDFIEKISRNCTMNTINKENLKMAVCVPDNFLENLTAVSNLTQKRDMFVVLTISKENYFISKRFSMDLYDVVSIKIPGYCKTNELPMLKVLYKDSSRVREYGRQYFDSSVSLEVLPCVLSRTLHVARMRNSSSFFESIKTQYCLRHPIGRTHISQTLADRRSYPESYCVNGNAEIPHLHCDYDTKSWKNESAMDIECRNEYATSINTFKIYQFATQCWNIDNFGDVFLTMNSTNLTAIDRKMFFDILECIVEFSITHILRADTCFEAISLALEFSRKLPREFTKSTKMSIFIVYCLIITNWYQVTFKDDNYIYQYLQSSLSSSVGIVVYKRGSDSMRDYDAKFLTKDNAIVNYALDPSVEVIMYVESLLPSYDDEVSAPSIFITRANLYPEDGNVTVKSKSLAIYSSKFTLELKIYLRLTESEANWRLSHYTSEGYWFNVTAQAYYVTVLSIVENYAYNYCESKKSIEIRNYASNHMISSDRSVMDKTTKNKIDLLSMISMSVNSAESKTGTEEIYNKYSSLLKFFRILTSLLSLLGVVLLFATALVLKNWAETRFYTIQLTIILAFQIVFFIGETQIGEIPQFVFFMFYYSILCQFCWMSLIGYVQYTRYIKVLGSRKLGILKSVIIGWLLPALIITISVLSYRDCFECNLCYKNKDIFLFFVLIPVGLVIVVNVIIYILAMMSIWSNQNGKSLAGERKTKVRASIFLPFLLGITWVFVFALISPWTWLFVVGLFLVHLILPSQALILCIFVVLLDKPTREQWKILITGVLRK